MFTTLGAFKLEIIEIGTTATYIRKSLFSSPYKMSEGLEVHGCFEGSTFITSIKDFKYEFTYGMLLYSTHLYFSLLT